MIWKKNNKENDLLFIKKQQGKSWLKSFLIFGFLYIIYRTKQTFRCYTYL